MITFEKTIGEAEHKSGYLNLTTDSKTTQGENFPPPNTPLIIETAGKQHWANMGSYQNQIWLQRWFNDENISMGDKIRITYNPLRENIDGRVVIEISLLNSEVKFEKEVEKSRKLSIEERLNKIKDYPEYPIQEKREINIYKRNPHIVAEVLERAGGICQHCEKEAPFIRVSDNTPFLEVHHMKSLSDGGEDTIDNTIALCPNCHRGVHYGGFQISNKNN